MAAIDSTRFAVLGGGDDAEEEAEEGGYMKPQQTKAKPPTPEEIQQFQPFQEDRANSLMELSEEEKRENLRIRSDRRRERDRSPPSAEHRLYAGVLTKAQAEKKVKQRTDFAIYHRAAHDVGDKSTSNPDDVDLQPHLYLNIVYLSSGGKYFHHPINEESQPDGNIVYRIQCIHNVPQPYFHSITSLIDHYTKFAYGNQFSSGKGIQLGYGLPIFMRRRRLLIVLVVFLFVVSFTPLWFLYRALVDEFQGESQQQQQQLQLDEQPFDEAKFYRRLRGYNESAKCAEFPTDVAVSHPQCLRKMQWLEKGWLTHACYKKNGVDGTLCSLRTYLSDVENYCPSIGDAGSREHDSGQRGAAFYAKINKDMDDLFEKMSDVPDNYLYMKTRISSLWTSWVRGIDEAVQRYPVAFHKRRRLNILILVGFLANESTIKFAKKSGQGGPLGELLQWSDLIAALSVLGHNLHIATDKITLKNIVAEYSLKPPCPDADGSSPKIDLIFTDIMGLRAFRKHRGFIVAHKCRIRLLDSFGTHAEFGTRSYFNAHKDELSGSETKKNPWGGHSLRLQQHWTFYPHSHDNTFLGFVVDANQNGGFVQPTFARSSRNASLVYGKEQYMWKNVARPIQVLKELTEVHATVADALNTSEASLFDGVVNHGFLHMQQIAALLASVKIFFGMGFPLEGPAPLEAVAHGVVFINAAFRVPKMRKNDKFLAEKPTLREWTSQCPYMEEIGPPHVYTVDIDDEQSLREAIRKALENPPQPMVPEEFTARGMLVRVSRLAQLQDFCGDNPGRVWPPPEALRIVKSDATRGESCEKACIGQGLVCEPSFFPIVNSEENIVKLAPRCRELVRTAATPLAPHDCVRQSLAALFSCASTPPDDARVTRICPCRDFVAQQHALCTTCLV